MFFLLWFEVVLLWVYLFYSWNLDNGVVFQSTIRHKKRINFFQSLVPDLNPKFGRHPSRGVHQSGNPGHKMENLVCTRIGGSGFSGITQYAPRRCPTMPCTARRMGSPGQISRRPARATASPRLCPPVSSSESPPPPV